jgi:hypothetical protein
METILLHEIMRHSPQRLTKELTKEYVVILFVHTNKREFRGKPY